MSTISRWFPNASCPIFFCMTLVQDIKLWIVSIWQCFPSGRSATVGLKQKSVRGMPWESDISSFNMLPSPCKSLEQGRILGTHPITSPVIQETKTSGWCHNQQVLKERQHWDNNLGSEYQDQSRTSNNMMLLTLSLSGIIPNSIEICITTREPDKYTEAQNMN